MLFPHLIESKDVCDALHHLNRKTEKILTKISEQLEERIKVKQSLINGRRKTKKDV